MEEDRRACGIARLVDGQRAAVGGSNLPRLDAHQLLAAMLERESPTRSRTTWRCAAGNGSSRIVDTSRLYGIPGHRPETGAGAAPEPTNGVAMVSRVAAKQTTGGTRRLVIVESPAKAKTIAGYLGADFVVESSIGHIRDLPNRASDVPKEKREEYGTIGVAIEADFKPLYVVDADKKQRVADLKRKLKDADELYLATDEDREGEAIAWHLLEVLQPKIPVRRMVFHEITKDAITRALGETREVDQRLVDAQETRRILDRLYGYEVSPVLWKKVMPRLSAGRVQSVAVRLVVERERERRAFVSAGVLGHRGPASTRARSTPGSSPSTASASRRAATSRRTGR